MKILNSIFNRVLVIYRTLFLLFLGFVFLFLVLPYETVSQLYLLEGVILVLVTSSIILGRPQGEPRDLFQQIMKVLTLTLVCLTIIWGLRLPFSFYEMLPLESNFFMQFIMIACVLGVGANVLLLWAYCLLEHRFELKKYPQILVRSLFEALDLVRKNPWVLGVFALNNIIALGAGIKLVELFDHVQYMLYDSFGVTLFLRVWMPVLLIAPWYVAVTSVMYEKLTNKR